MMQRYRQRPTYVEAVKITDEMIDAKHPSDLHIPGVVYDPVARIARVPSGAYALVGHWIVREVNEQLTVWGDALFKRMYQKCGDSIIIGTRRS